MSYKELAIWQIAKDVVVEIHKMTMTSLPSFELYEAGSQIRRSSKSIKSNIVEGYGRKRYKSDFIKFLVIAQASCFETLDHLETLFETGSLKDKSVFESIHEKLDHLGRKLNLFIKAVEKNH